MHSDEGPHPRRAARLELARAALDLASWTLPLSAYMLTAKRHKRQVRADIAGAPAVPDDPALPPLPHEPLRIVLSCAEESGEVHAANLARALLRECAAAGAPAPDLVGFGGTALAAAGVTTLADPARDATMKATGALAKLPFYVGLLETLAQHARSARPHLFLPVDSPALHVPMARLVGRYGVPTLHHIAPQFWAWAPWRVKRYTRHVAEGLTILPFEPRWYARHAVPITHVGHPLLDALAVHPTPPAPDHHSRRQLVLLPGSRRGEIEDNLGWMLELTDEVVAARPGLVRVICQAHETHAQRIRSILAGRTDVQLAIGSLHEHLGTARAALAVSGTILTDLLFQRVPHVAIYRDTGIWKARIGRFFLTSESFASTNLIAGENVAPEYGFRGDGPREAVARDLTGALDDGPRRAELLAGLDLAAERIGPPGASRRAARRALALAAQSLTLQARMSGSGRPS